MNAPDVTIIAPAKNEAQNLPLLAEKLREHMPPDISYEIIIIDDGSTDDTLEVLRALSEDNDAVKFVSFTRNFGHQAALLAGIQSSAGRCVIAMDADLQHPPALLPKMIAAWRNGADIVMTERLDDNERKRAKALSSRLYYRLLGFLADFEIRPGSADFYLIDRKVLNVLAQFEKSTLFLRGLLPTLGFATERIAYEPRARAHGRTSYTFGKMIQLGLNGVLSMSIKPLRLGIFFALLAGALAALYGIYVIVVFLTGEAVPGWASVALVSSIIGAMQLFVLGVIGEYIGRVLNDVRARPPYIVRETNAAAPAALRAAPEEMQRHVGRS